MLSSGLIDIHVVELYNLLCPMWSGGVCSWIIVQSTTHLSYEIIHLALVYPAV